jgi:hypothetical protein
MYLNTFNFDFDSLKNLPKLINYVGAEPTAYDKTDNVTLADGNKHTVYHVDLFFDKSQDNIEKIPNKATSESALINLMGFTTKPLLHKFDKNVENVGNDDTILVIDGSIAKTEFLQKTQIENKTDYYFSYCKDDTTATEFNFDTLTVISDTLRLHIKSNQISILQNKKIYIFYKQEIYDYIIVDIPLLVNSNSSEEFFKTFTLNISNTSDTLILNEDKTTERNTNTQITLTFDSRLHIVDNNNKYMFYVPKSDDIDYHLLNYSDQAKIYSFYKKSDSAPDCPGSISLYRLILDTTNTKKYKIKEETKDNDKLAYSLLQFPSLPNVSNSFGISQYEISGYLEISKTPETSIEVNLLVLPHYTDNEIVILKKYDNIGDSNPDEVFYLSSALNSRLNADNNKPKSPLTIYSSNSNYFDTKYTMTISIPNSNDFKLNTLKVVGIDKVYEDLS